MSKITEIVDDVISKTNTNTTDIANTSTRLDSHIGLSGVTAYHLLQGNLAVDNTVTTQGFNTTLYTGNGSTQSINTGVDMATQWGSDTTETYGGLVWIKNRGDTQHNHLFDTIRGVQHDIRTNTTDSDYVNSGYLTAFSNVGFSVGSDWGVNRSTYNHVSWNFQTTHRTSGTTNHGKAYTCHYNPFTGFTIVKYEGSGIAGHEIPHHLGRKLGFVTIKNLSAISQWFVKPSNEAISYMTLSTTDALSSSSASELWSNGTESNFIVNTNAGSNTSSNQYILYGWANSYFDESNKLIGNYEVGVYQGTGASGNKVKTRGKPAWVMIKRLDAVGHWMLQDNMRIDRDLYANLSQAENPVTDVLDFLSDGILLKNTNTDVNASGGQYLYMVAYDTNSNGGGSYYPRATDTSNLQVQNAIIPFANGIDSNGSKITTLSKNETISGLTLTAGKNYVYSKNDGTYGVKSIAPNYGKTNPANGGDFYDVLENKWYTSAGVEIPESRNYMNHIVYADNDGSPLYVEELPKTEYKDSLQVNSLNVLSGFNLNQTWQNVTSSRVAGATYTNTTGKPIVVALSVYSTTATNLYALLFVDGSAVASPQLSPSPTLSYITVNGVVPPNSTYKCDFTGTLTFWRELR